MSQLGGQDFEESIPKTATTCSVTAVMATYFGDQKDHLRSSIGSIFAQSVMPDEIVIVLDGVVPDENLSVINSYKEHNKDVRFKVISLDQSIGPGGARNVAVQNSTNPLIAIFDADDISLCHRIQVQSDYMHRHRNVSMLSSYEAEFEDGREDHITSYKTVPLGHIEIRKKIVWRCCILNSSLMIRKDVFLNAGGYPTFRHHEDWLLFIRVLRAGGVAANIPQVLVKFRTSQAQRIRRGGGKRIKNDIAVAWDCFCAGDYGFFRMIMVVMAWIPFRLCPASLKKLVYSLVRSKSIENKLPPT